MYHQLNILLEKGNTHSNVIIVVVQAGQFSLYYSPVVSVIFVIKLMTSLTLWCQIMCDNWLVTHLLIEMLYHLLQPNVMLEYFKSHIKKLSKVMKSNNEC